MPALSLCPLKPCCRHRVFECIPSTARGAGNITEKHPDRVPVLTHLTRKCKYEQGDFRGHKLYEDKMAM